MSSILEIANTETKRNLLRQSVAMYLSNLKCQLERTKTGFNDKKTVIGKDGMTAVERISEKVRECKEMLEVLNEELFVG